MTRATSKKEIEKKVLGGVLSASSKYIRISGNVSLCDAPEYFLTVSVAESLSRGGKNYVTLEDKVKEIIKYAGGNVEGTAIEGSPKRRQVGHRYLAQDKIVCSGQRQRGAESCYRN